MNDGGIVYYVDPDDGNLYVRDDFVPVKSSADILQISIELENGKMWIMELKRQRVFKTDGSITTWWVFEGPAEKVKIVQDIFERWRREKKIPR